MRKAEEMLQKAKNNDNGFGDKEIIQLMKEYAKSVAQQALDNASENVKLTITATIWDNDIVKDMSVDKSSITNPNNIPTI